MTRFEQIQQAALALSPDEKERLVQILIQDLEKDQQENQEEIDRVWDKEIQRRGSDIEAGRVTLRSMEEISMEIRANCS